MNSSRQIISYSAPRPQEGLVLAPQKPQSVRYEIDFAETWRILKRRKYITFAVVILTLGVVIALALLMPSRYEAVARIDVDLTTSMPTLDEAATAPVEGTSQDPSTRLTSQVEILRTDAIAWDTISKLRLDQKASFTAGFLSIFTKATGVSPANTDIDRITPQRRMKLVEKFHNRLSVKLVPKTEIIEVRFRDRDPILAAQVVNTLADDYVGLSLRHRFATTMQASAWLTTQLDDLKNNVEKTEAKFAAYQKEKGIIQTHLGSDSGTNGSQVSGSGTIVLDKLEETNHELAAAEADRIVKEARLRTAQSRDPELIATMSSSAPGPAATLQALRTQQAALNTDLARETSYYGDTYPTVVQLRKQLAEIDTAIDNAMERLKLTYLADYDQALANERMLSRSMEEQKEEAFRENQDAVRMEVLRKDAEASRDTYDDVLKKLKIAGVLAGLNATNLTIVDPAAIPATPVEPRAALMIAFALFGGLLAGIGASFAAESLDATIRTPEDVESLCGMQSLGIVPRFAAARMGRVSSRKFDIPEVVSHPRSQAAEAYRCLRTALLLADPASVPKVIAFTSALPKEGKTTTSINMAILMAQKGSRVLLVDADLRRPSVHQKLGLKSNGGLSAALLGAEPSHLIIRGDDTLRGLDVLTAGPRVADPVELLDSKRMRELVSLWAKQYDHVLIDCAPTLGMADSIVIAAMVDSVVVVTRSGVTRYQTLRRIRDLLSSMSVPIAGVVVNAVDTNSESHYAYYGYYGRKYSAYYLSEGTGEAGSR